LNIYQSIKQDHHIQRKLLEQMLRTSGDTKNRSDLFDELKAELAGHANAEERHFYVPLIKLESTQGAARHGMAEHHEIDELLEQLERTDPSSPVWLKYAKDLADKVRHHLSEEEVDYFPMVQKLLSEEKAELLGEAYLSARAKERIEA